MSETAAPCYESNHGGDSWLFCTPPPDEMQSHVPGGNERVEHGKVIPDVPIPVVNPSPYYQEAQNGSEKDTAENNRPSETLHNSAKGLWILDPDWLALGLRYGNQRDEAGSYIDQGLSMAPSVASITSRTGSTNDGSVSARSHLTSDNIDKSHLPTTKSTDSEKIIHFTNGHKPTHTSRSLRQLTGYSTSEEEATIDTLSAQKPSKLNYQKQTSNPLGTLKTSKARKRDRISKFKSAEFVDSESDSDSDNNNHKQFAITKEPRHKPGFASQALDRPSKPTTNACAFEMNPGSTEARLKGGLKTLRPSTSMTTKARGAPTKRPASSQATPRKAFKRPKTLGGFVDDSDEDESESEIAHDNHGSGSGDQSENEEDLDNKDGDSATPPLPPVRQLSLHQRKITPRPAPTPNKANYNVARLRMLLGRKNKPSNANHNSPVEPKSGSPSRVKQMSKPSLTAHDSNFEALRDPNRSVPAGCQPSKSPMVMGDAKLQSASGAPSTLSEINSQHAPSTLSLTTLAKPALRTVHNPTGSQATKTWSEGTLPSSRAKSQSTTSSLESKTDLGQSPQKKAVNSTSVAKHPPAMPVAEDHTPGVSTSSRTQSAPRTSSSAGLVGGLLRGIRQNEGGHDPKVGNTLSTASPVIGRPKKATQKQLQPRVNSDLPRGQSLHQVRSKQTTNIGRTESTPANTGEDKVPNGPIAAPIAKEKDGPPKDVPLSCGAVARDQRANMILSRASSSKEAPSNHRRDASPGGLGTVGLPIKDPATIAKSKATTAGTLKEGQRGPEDGLKSDVSPIITAGDTPSTARKSPSVATGPVPRAGHKQEPAARPDPQEGTSAASTKTTKASRQQTRMPAEATQEPMTAKKNVAVAKVMAGDNSSSSSNTSDHQTPTKGPILHITPRTVLSVSIANKKAQPATTVRSVAATDVSSVDACVEQELGEVATKSSNQVTHAIAPPLSSEPAGASQSPTIRINDHNETQECIDSADPIQTPAQDAFTNKNEQWKVSAVESAPKPTLNVNPAVDRAASSAKTSFEAAAQDAGKISQPNEPAQITTVDLQRRARQSEEQNEQRDHERSTKVDHKAAPSVTTNNTTPAPPVEPQLAPAVQDKIRTLYQECLVTTTPGPSEPIKAGKEQHADSTEEHPLPIVLLATSPNPAADAEPYFEYSIHQNIWSESTPESSSPSTECSRPLTCIEEANAQAETLSRALREQYQQHFRVHFSGWNNEKDNHGCDALTSTFAPVDDPRKKSYMKVWVQRNYVSAYAGVKPADLPRAPFVAKTVYVLRLFKLVGSNAESDAEDAVEGEDTRTETVSRIYHPLPRTECYTTLDAANRAARDVQLEMSLKKDPRELEKIWQEQKLRELHNKVRELGEDTCWKSEFNGSGLGSARFELVVEEVGLCGPRNL